MYDDEMTRLNISLKQIVAHLGPLVSSQSWESDLKDKDLYFNFVTAPDLATSADLVFVSNSKHVESALNSSAFALCLPESLKPSVESRQPKINKLIFYSPEPERAMRETIQRFFLKTPYVNSDEPSLKHRTALIHPEAEVSPSARIGAYSVISRGVKIHDDVVIASHVVVEIGAEIGARTVVHPFVYIGHHTEIGADCEIHPHSAVGKEGFGYAHDPKGRHYRIPHQGKVVLEDGVHLGSTATIDRGTFGETRIGKGAILDNRIHIAHNVSIGAGSIITAGFNVAGSTKIGRGFVCGGNTSVTGHIEICDGVQLAGVSVVRRSISKPGAYGGNPLMPMREFMRMNLALLKLPGMLKRLGLTKANDEGE